MYFTLNKAQKYIEDLRKHVYEDKVEIESFKHVAEDIPGAHAVDFNDHNWEDFATGNSWGGYDETHWFRATVQIPEGWKNDKVALFFIVGAGQEGGLRGS